MAKLFTKEKTQAQQERDDQRDRDMVTFGLGFKDFEGNPWFLSVEGGGYSVNPKCKATTDEFNKGLRIYISK